VVESGRRQQARYPLVPAVTVLRVQQKMLVQRGADERSTDGARASTGVARTTDQSTGQ
jgi:hypothetical protein